MFKRRDQSGSPAYDEAMPLAPDQRLSNEEFEEVVEEIARKQSDAERGVSVDEARSALQELDLPASKLDEATELIRARRAQEARVAQKKRRVLLAVASAVALVLAVGTAIGVSAHSRSTKVSAMTASETTLTEESGQLRLSTKLMAAPKGESVPMTCAWRSPEGTLIHENAWKTKPISHDAWETHCVLQKAPPHVKVEMRAFDRVVAESSR